MSRRGREAKPCDGNALLTQARAAVYNSAAGRRLQRLWRARYRYPMKRNALIISLAVLLTSCTKDTEQDP